MTKPETSAAELCVLNPTPLSKLCWRTLFPLQYIRTPTYTHVYEIIVRDGSFVLGIHGMSGPCSFP